MQTPRPLDPEMLRPERYPLLRFDDEDWLWFENACHDLEIGLDDEKRERLERLYSHLVGVNEWMNLTRLTSVADYLKFHVFDSLTALSPISELTEPGDVCLDLGSGGGYPGLPLATWLPDRHWFLVDSRRKKVAFLAEALKLTGCKAAEAEAFRGREVASTRADLVGACRLVVARAVGRADKLLAEAGPLLKLNGFLLLLKGPSFAEEEYRDVMAAGSSHGFEFVQKVEMLLEPGDPERILVLLAKTDEVRPGQKRRGRR